MEVLNAIRSFDSQEGNNVDEMVLMLATANSMISTYNQLGEAPEWLVDRQAQLTARIEATQRDTLERELKEIQGRREALKSAEEKRGDLAEKEERILKKLGRK